MRLVNESIADSNLAYRKRVRGTGGPAMSITDPSIIRVGRVVQSAIRTVTLYERGIGHARVIHHVPPLSPDQLKPRSRIIESEVCVQLHTGNKR